MLTYLAALAVLGTPDPVSLNVLVFSKTGGFRHDSIPAGQAMMQELAKEHGFKVELTEDASLFTPYNLRKYDTVVFLNTTGDILSTGQQSAFEEFVTSGGGYVGIHAASDTEYSWPWYGDMVGAYFAGHPAIQAADIRNEDPRHPTMKMWPEAFKRTDEWYDYKPNPRANVTVLASLDTKTYEGHKMGDDHPITWCREVGKGRSWYTGFGHTKETYAEPAFREMVRQALLWATRR
jgi:type 1 glutamine amidotransferase